MQRTTALAIAAGACLSAATIAVLAWPEPQAPLHAPYAMHPYAVPPYAAPPSQDLRQPRLPDDVRDVLPDYVEYPGLLPGYALDEIYVMCRSPANYMSDAEGALQEAGGDVYTAVELASMWFAPYRYDFIDSDCYWHCILQGWNRTSCDPVYAPIALPCDLEDRGQCGWASCRPVRDGNATHCGYVGPGLEGDIVRWDPLDADAIGKREIMRERGELTLPQHPWDILQDPAAERGGSP